MTTTKLSPVDVVLVTGPAGVGKTAFIEACVRGLPERWRRVGYVSHRFVQEFGNTPPLPPALGAGVKHGGFYASVFDFGSGCVCCSPRGDFRRTLLELRQQRLTAATESGTPLTEKPGAPRGVPNLLFVETTGLALSESAPTVARELHQTSGTHFSSIASRSVKVMLGLSHGALYRSTSL